MEALRSSYKKEREVGTAAVTHAVSKAKDAADGVRDATTNAQRARLEQGEHAQVDEAILLSFISGFGKDFSVIVAELRERRAQFLVEQQKEAVAIIDAKLARLNKLKPLVEGYQKYHQDIGRRAEIAIRQGEIGELLKSDGLNPSERKKLEKEEQGLTRELADIGDSILNIQDTFGYSSEEGLRSRFDEAESFVLKGISEENPVKMFRDNETATVSEFIKDGVSATDLSTMVAEKLQEALGDAPEVLVKEQDKSLANKLEQ